MAATATHTHDHDHDHGSGPFDAATHGHTHEHLDGPGSYLGREMPLADGRDWAGRAFTVGIGGYVIHGCAAQRDCFCLAGCLLSPVACLSSVPHLVVQISTCQFSVVVFSILYMFDSILLRISHPLHPNTHRPVGSGKTALMLALCRKLRTQYSLCAVTNDIFTREDAEFLTRHQALPAARIRALETGGCPHAAVREDISGNLLALEGLQQDFQPDLLLIESGGDNLAANYSRELADFIIYVIDVAGGDKVPRKGGPGITGSDLLVVNKTDLAEAVGADLGVMERDARRMREGGPTVFAVVKHDKHVDDIVSLVLSAWKASGAYDGCVEKWKLHGKKNSLDE